MNMADGIVMYLYNILDVFILLLLLIVTTPNKKMIYSKYKLIAPSRFELESLARKAGMIDRYNTGLSTELPSLLLHLLLLLNLGPSVTESYCSVNDKFFLSCIWIYTEIAQAFKLESIYWFQIP